VVERMIFSSAHKECTATTAAMQRDARWRVAIIAYSQPALSYVM